MTKVWIDSNFYGFHTFMILRSSMDTNSPFKVNKAFMTNPICPLSSPANGLERDREGSQRNNSVVNIHEQI